MDLNHTLQKKRQNLFEHDHVITSFAFLKEHTCRSVYMYMYVVRSCTNFQSYVFCLYICKWFGPRSGLTKYLADLDTKTFSKNTRVDQFICTCMLFAPVRIFKHISSVVCLHFCKRFGPRSGQTKYLADLDTNSGR